MDHILQGHGHEVRKIAISEWRSRLAAARPRIAERLQFMTPLHRRLREFVVRELPRRGRALSPAWIAKSMGEPREEIVRALGELEERLFFLVRNRRGDVAWAFPVTVEPTAHRLTFSTGERLSGA